MKFFRSRVPATLLAAYLLMGCSSSTPPSTAAPTGSSSEPSTAGESATNEGQDQESTKPSSVRVKRAEAVGRTLFRLHKGARVAWTALSKKIGPLQDKFVYLPSLEVEDGVFVNKVSVGFFTSDGREAHRLTILLGGKQIDFQHFDPPQEAHPKATILLEARKTVLSSLERHQPVDPIMFFDPEGRPVVYLLATEPDAQKRYRKDVAVFGQHFEVVVSDDGKEILSSRASTESRDVRSLFDADGQRTEQFQIDATHRASPNKFDYYAALMWGTPIHLTTSEAQWMVRPEGIEQVHP